MIKKITKELNIRINKGSKIQIHRKIYKEDANVLNIIKKAIMRKFHWKLGIFIII